MSCFACEVDQADQPNESSKEEGTRKGNCTDRFWFHLFFAICMIEAAIDGLIYYRGYPRRLINRFDSFGNTCGVDSSQKNPDLPLSGMDMTDRPYQLFLDTDDLANTISICVKECPQRDLLDNGEIYSYYEERQVNFCQYDFNISLLLAPDGSEAELFDLAGSCPTLPVYQSAPVLHRCIQTDKNTTSQQMQKMYALINSWEGAQQVFSDLVNTWPTILLSIGLAFCISIGLICLLYSAGTIVSYFLCFCGVLLSVGFAVVLWLKYYYLTQNTLDVDQQFSFLESNENTILFLAIFATLIEIYVALAIFCWRKELAWMGDLYKKTGDCILQLKNQVFVVLGPLLLMVVALVWQLYIFIHLETTILPGEIPPMPLMPLEGNSTFDNSFKTFKLEEHHEDNTMRYVYRGLNIIGLISMVLFIGHLLRLAIAGVVAPWYFFKPTLSVSEIAKYHLGSVAKGSLFITICKIPRTIFVFLNDKKENGSMWGNCCFRCCPCGFWLVEKYIHYISHSAYIITALGRLGFCSAAKMSWEAQGKYWRKVTFIGETSGFVLFLGKLVIAVLCGLISTLFLRDNPALYNYMAPVSIISVVAFFTADIILSAYEMVADTLLLCCTTQDVSNAGRCEQYNFDEMFDVPPMYRRRGTREAADEAGDANGAGDTHLPATISGTIPPPAAVERQV